MARTYKIIIISGPSNAGKSTVSNILIQTLPKTVKIELDDIGHISKVLPHKDRGQCVFEDAAAVAANWINRGFDVIFLGAFWGLKPLRDALTPRLGEHQVEYHRFTLAPPLEIALQTRGPRKINEKDRDWVRQTYEWKLHDVDSGFVIDNQNQTPEQTADLIAGYIKEGKAEVVP